MNSDDLFEQAERLEEEGKLPSAIEVWRSLASKERDPVVLCRLGQATKQLGNLVDAQLCFEKALEIDFECRPALVALGLLFIDRGEYVSAESHLKRALAIEKDAAVYTLLGIASSGIDHITDAKEYFQKALCLDPEYEEAYFNLAVLLRTTAPVDSESLFVKALEIDEDYAEAHRELGFLLASKNVLPEAEYHLRRASELNGKDPWVPVYLGNLLWRKGDLPAALEAFEHAVKLRPDSSVPLWSLANLLEAIGDKGKAELLYRRAVELEPDDAEASMNLGRMLVRMGDLAAGKQHLDRALALDPTNQQALKVLKEIERAK